VEKVSVKLKAERPPGIARVAAETIAPPGRKKPAT
jgi:hypothetical protein